MNKFLSAVLLVMLLSWSVSEVVVAGDKVPYSSVDEALADLKQQPGAVVEEINGWTIITFSEMENQVLWSFVPEYHYAYPSVARREATLEGQTWAVNTTLLCGNSEAACAELHKDFDALDLKIRESLADQALGRIPKTTQE